MSTNKRKEFTGKRFGRLVVLGDAEDKVLPSGYKQRHVLCQCDCGSTTSPRLMDVKLGKTVSCGCYGSAATSKRNVIMHREGRLKTDHLRRGSEPDEYTNFRYILKATKRSSRKSKSNTLTLEDVKRVWVAQNGRCAYSGLSLVCPTHSDTLQDTPQYLKASIDRIDSDKGYHADNIHIVSQTINYAKNRMTHEEMIEFLSILRDSPHLSSSQYDDEARGFL